MGARQYDYNSQRSLAVISLILKYLRSKAKSGCTQAGIAQALGMGITGVSRYMAHMCDMGMIHIAVPVEARQRGHQPALYKPGPPAPIRKRKPSYMNDPLLAAFYGGITA